MFLCWWKGHVTRWVVNGRCINQVCQRPRCGKVFHVFVGGRADADWLNGTTPAAMMLGVPISEEERDAISKDGP